MELIKQIKSDILDLDSKIAIHTTKLESVITDTLKRICDEEEKLASMINKNIHEYKKNEVLIASNNKLGLEIKKGDSNLLYINSRIKEIGFSESKIEMLSTKIKELSVAHEKLLSETEISKTDREIILIEVSGLGDTITNLNKEHAAVTESILSVKNEYMSVSSSIDNASSKLNVLRSQCGTYTNNKINDERGALKANEELHKILDNISESKTLLSNTETKNKHELEVVKVIKSDIASLNEIKDNITHEIENAKNKSRSDESRILAIKKEVLRYVLDNKKHIDDKKINKFIKDLK